MTTSRNKARLSRLSFSGFLVLALGILLLLLTVGYVPTRNLGGDRAIEAMLVGCGASLAGSLLGAIVVKLAGRARSAAGSGAAESTVVPVVLGSMALRMFMVLVLGLGLVLVGKFKPAPLLLWVAISHAGLLVADTTYSLSVLVGAPSGESEQVGEDR